MRTSFGSTVSKRVTVWPASARWSVRAVRKMVSPSGISVGFRKRRFRHHGFNDVAHLQAERRLHESSFFQEAGEEVFAGRSFVDFPDEQAGAARLPADGDRGEA